MPVAIGTSAYHAKSGIRNQRSAMRGTASGVQMLTVAIAASRPSRSPAPKRRARASTSPSVFSTSHVAPISA